MKLTITLFRLFFPSTRLLKVLLWSINFIFWRMWASFSATWTRPYHLITFKSLLHTLQNFFNYRLSIIFATLFFILNKLCTRNSLPPAFPCLLILLILSGILLFVFGGFVLLIMRKWRIMLRAARGWLRQIIVLFARTFIFFL